MYLGGPLLCTDLDVPMLGRFSSLELTWKALGVLRGELTPLAGSIGGRMTW